MKKYFQISVSQLVDTFSRIESGSTFDFIIHTSDKGLNDLTISQGDVIIVSINDSVYYNFDVLGKTTNEIQLKKSFEILKHINYSISEIGVFEEISESDYNSICSQLFSDYGNVISLSTSKLALGDIKEEFANWLFNLGKYSRVYKGDKSTLIRKLQEFETAYNNDFGILIFDYPTLSLEKIIEALETNIIDETGEIGDLNRRTVGNGSVKAILGTNNYIKFLKEILLKSKISNAKSPKITQKIKSILVLPVQVNLIK